MHLTDRRSRTGAVAAIVATGLLAACGSSGSSSTATTAAPTATTAAGGGSATTAAPSVSSPTSGAPGASTGAYSGVEAQLPHALPAPTPKAGYSFTIGWLIPNGSIPSLQELTTGIKREASALGGKVVVLDSQLNPQTEVSNFNQLLAQHVSAIVSFPLDPASLAPSLAQAKKEGIPVVAIDAPPAASSPLIPGYVADILLSRDLGAYTVAHKAAATTPGAGFALLGIAAPIPSLTYVIAQEKYWGAKAGLKFLGEVDSQADTSAGAATAMSGILAKYPSVKYVFTYNDVSGVGAAAQTLVNANSAVKVIGFDGEDEALQAVKAGRLFGTYNVPFTQNGSEAVIALYDTLTKQHLPLPAKISNPGALVSR